MENENYSNNGTTDKGFVHSAKVPDIYKSCTKILRDFKNGKGSLKNLIFSNRRHKDVNRLLALSSRSANRFEELQKLLTKLNLFEDQPRFDPFMAIILASEVIEKGMQLGGNCRPVLTINLYADKILSSFSTLTEANVKEVILPKYVRINTLKISAEDIHNELSNLNFFYIFYDQTDTSYDNFLELVKNLKENEYVEDYHIPNLLVFPPNQQFWFLDLYKNGCIIIQNKASCIPAYISGIKPGYNVVDACSAPGNKTTQLAALMHNEGSIKAVEKSSERYITLKNLVKERDATCVKTLRMDFSRLDVSEEVDLILVDPSCSASGTDVHNEKLSEERIENLSYIQHKLLSHALSFSNVKTVIYSTCSINEQENEQVIEKALLKFGSEFKLKKLAKYFPGWNNSSDFTYDCAKYCIRTSPEKDLCQGFFVAKFCRRTKRKAEQNSDEENSTNKRKKIKK